MGWAIEFEEWASDIESTPRLVGPFASKEQAKAWVKENGWAKGYDPRWSLRVLRTPWSGAMQSDGSVRSRQAS